MFVVSVDITTGLSPQVEVDLEAPVLDIPGILGQIMKPFVVPYVRQLLESELNKLIKYF